MDIPLPNASDAASAATPIAEWPPVRIRLPLRFEPEALLPEVAALSATDWVEHFNKGYHNGGWSGITLLGSTTDAQQLYVSPADRGRGGAAPESDPGTESNGRGVSAGIATAAFDSSPRLAAALGQLHCPIRAARLLRLAPGGVIEEHADADLDFADGEARLHIVLQTDPAVEFYVAGQRVMMSPGECWYLDLARPHRVSNRSAAARIHLVVDVRVNAWLRAQIAAGDCPVRTPLQPSGSEEFARFREHVWSDQVLAARLRSFGADDDFIAAVMAEGLAAGFLFQAADVSAAMNATRREWIEQWLV